MRPFDIVIPMYNEYGRIESTTRSIYYFMKDHPGLVGKVILVDDCSTDRTVEWCRFLTRKMPVEIVYRNVNGGKWAAIRDGLKRAKGRVLLMDADGSAGIENILEVEGDPDVVLGNRFGKNSVVRGKGLVRRIVSRGYRFYVDVLYRWAGGKMQVRDMQCPLKLIDVSQIDVNELSVDRFAGDVELMVLLSRSVVGKVQNVDVEFNHTRGSKVKPVSILEMAIDTWKVAKRLRSTRAKDI